ncbi:hypothetical protein [Hymenobacter cavernae]|nr:hypothetical protein [Hymenobacter cavernae]
MQDKAESTTLVHPDATPDFYLSNKTLGTLGMLGAPFLALAMLWSSFWGKHWLNPSYLDGVLCLVYISAWMCSMLGLVQLRATGESRFGRGVLYLIFSTLTLANCWNTYHAIHPNAWTLLYRALDAFWPISNLVMLVVGITIAHTKGLPGWRRYVPLAVGLWLPSVALVYTCLGNNLSTMLFDTSYTTSAWLTLGYVVRTSPES